MERVTVEMCRLLKFPAVLAWVADDPGEEASGIGVQVFWGLRAVSPIGNAIAGYKGRVVAQSD